MNPKFRDLNVPDKVYKYRDWNDSYHKKILTEPSIFAAPPKSFEDTLECRNSTRYDLLSDIDIFNKFYEISKKENPEYDFKEHINFAGYWFRETPLRNPIEYFLLMHRSFEEFNDRFGIFSVTTNPYSRRMWEKYGADNKGYCVGFDSSRLIKFFGGGSQVQYQDHLPIIEPFEDFLIQHYKQVFYKTTEWSFEEEYRLHKFWNIRVTTEQRNIQIDHECISEVIFGPEMRSEDIEEITEIVQQNNSTIDIIQASQGQLT